MKNHFIKLFNYDRLENEKILNVIIEAGEPEKPVQLMAHLLTAQQIWLNRLQNLPAPVMPLWPPLGQRQENLKAIITSNSVAWIDYLHNLTAPDFEKTIDYKSMRGDEFRNRLDDIITHVINHGTHHRAQIGQIVKLAGHENLPGTDYILYVRSLNS